MQKTVLAFGELLWDLLPSGAVLGGAPANFAYRINALGERAIIVSRLGRDALGKSAFAHLEALGMETGYLQWDDTFPTGTVQVQVDGKGNPDFYIVPDVAYDQIESSDALLALAGQVDCICFGTLAQRTDRSYQTLRTVLSHAANALKLLDLNLRKQCYSTATITESLKQADILKLNEDEMNHLAELFELPGESVAEFAKAAVGKWALSFCLITLGQWGAFVASNRDEAIYSPGYEVELVDTCGSGDAVSAGFLYNVLQGESTGRCLEAGNVLGAIVATQRGATQPISTADLEAFLQRKTRRHVDPRIKAETLS